MNNPILTSQTNLEGKVAELEKQVRELQKTVKWLTLYVQRLTPGVRTFEEVAGVGMVPRQ